MFEKVKSWFNEYTEQIAITLGMSVIAAMFLSFLYWDHNLTEKANRQRNNDCRAAFAKVKSHPGDIVKLKLDGTKVIIVDSIYHYDTKTISHQVKKDGFGAAFEVYDVEIAVDTDAEVKPFAY